MNPWTWHGSDGQKGEKNETNNRCVTFGHRGFDAFDQYNNLLKEGVCREQARAVLPQSLLTRFYMTGNLRNWAHFLKLRLDSHAQPEVQIIAQRIEAELRKLWPLPMDALMETTNAID